MTTTTTTQANFIASLLHLIAAHYHYLDALASLIVMTLSCIMLTITLQRPESLMIYFETTNAEYVFSWRMRSLADIIQVLFLVACGLFGCIMAIVTGAFTVLAFTLAKKRPDIFRALFRKYAGDPMEAYEHEGGGGGEGDASTRGGEMSYDHASETTGTRV